MLILKPTSRRTSYGNGEGGLPDNAAAKVLVPAPDRKVCLREYRSIPEMRLSASKLRDEEPDARLNC